MQVIDENEDTWVLSKGDPGYEAAHYLKGMNYQVIMLPLRQILLSTVQRGTYLPPPTVEVLQGINSLTDTHRYVTYASLLDQWRALVMSDVVVLN